MQKVVAMIDSHYSGILNVVVSGVSDSRSAAINSKTEGLKSLSQDLFTRGRFRTATLFRSGNLDMPI